jgi:hypothetical protein
MQDDILKYIPVGKENAVTRQQLVKQTGLNDRAVREAISQARRDVVILNEQDGGGYFIPRNNEMNLVRKFVNQESKRAKSIFWSLKAAKNMVKKAGKEEVKQITYNDCIKNGFNQVKLEDWLGGV